MKSPIIATKLYRPPVRPEVIHRPHLTARLDEGWHRQLTLISAPAGFGKTTLVSEWLAGSGLPAAWLSLDSKDNDLTRFLIYLVSSLKTIPINLGDSLLGVLESPQPPSSEFVLTMLLNQISSVPDHFCLVLDDYHNIDSKTVSDALAFLLDHLPQQMHLVIVTREDPPLPLARLRARGQLTELRAADLRFSFSESAGFLNRVMGLHLSDKDISDLENRTEGWITGLQLAALSMQGKTDNAEFIHAFTGSHRFVLDYLIEEVLQKQPGNVQSFLLHTSILERMSGPLCDAVLLDPSASGQETLAYLDRANLFIVPLDTERRWYRYHHLFAELLRQRLHQSTSSGHDAGGIAEYHIRASRWFEDHDLEVEAFQHAVAANDIERAERLMEGGGMPLHYGSVVTAILSWLTSLPETVLDARPLLRVRTATLLLVTGQQTGVEEKLQAAETAIAASGKGTGPDDRTRDLIGQIAAARATLAFTRYQPEKMITQSRRALEYLLPGNHPFRFTANWLMGMACLFQGKRAAAVLVVAEALSIARATGDIHNTILASTSLGQIQELENRFCLAAGTYRNILTLAGDYPSPAVCEAYRGLAHISYEQNDLDAAGLYGQQSLQLARQYDRLIDRYVISEVFLARLKLARGDAAGASAMLAESWKSVQQYHFVQRIPEAAAAQVLVLLRQNNPAAAALLADTYDLPVSRAKVYMYEGRASEALALLRPLYDQFAQKGWQDEMLKVMVLIAVSYHMLGESSMAFQWLDKSLAMAEPEGFIRLFIDEGAPMARLLTDAAGHTKMSDYTAGLLAAFACELQTNDKNQGVPKASTIQSLREPLSQRELEVLRLVALGFSNNEICGKLFLALNTVKGHNRRIFEKLQVQRRTEAVARAREMGLI